MNIFILFLKLPQFSVSAPPIAQFGGSAPLGGWHPLWETSAMEQQSITQS